MEQLHHEDNFAVAIDRPLTDKEVAGLKKLSDDLNEAYRKGVAKIVPEARIVRVESKREEQRP